MGKKSTYFHINNVDVMCGPSIFQNRKCGCNVEHYGCNVDVMWNIMEECGCFIDVMWNIVEECGCFVEVIWNIVDECGCFVEKCGCNVDPPHLHIS